MKCLCFLLLSLLFFINCTTVVKCTLVFGQITLQSYGYTLEDMDTILVQWYQPGSHFTQLVREQSFYLSGPACYPNVADAPHLVVRDKAAPIDSFLLPFDFVDPIPGSYTANDAIIMVPAIDRSFHITDVVVSEIMIGTFGESFDNCTRHVTSFDVDNNTVITDNVIVAVK